MSNYSKNKKKGLKCTHKMFTSNQYKFLVCDSSHIWTAMAVITKSMCVIFQWYIRYHVYPGDNNVLTYPIYVSIKRSVPSVCTSSHPYQIYFIVFKNYEKMLPKSYIRYRTYVTKYSCRPISIICIRGNSISINSSLFQLKIFLFRYIISMMQTIFVC